VDPRASNLKVLEEATLTAEVEKALLSELAYQGLMRQQLVYDRTQFVDHIQAFLGETLTLPSPPNVLELLQRLTRQGLLNQRTTAPHQHHYSFAHRSLQEYLTARYLAQYDTPIEPIVQQYVADLHWREVFLFLAAQVDRCDRILELMAETAQQTLHSERIYQLLQWVNQSTQPSPQPPQSHAAQSHAAQSSSTPIPSNTLLRKRITALAIALDRALDITRSLKVDQAVNQALNFTLDLALVVDAQLALELDRMMTLDLDPERGRQVDLSLALGVTLELKRLQIFPDSKIAWLISRLETLKSRPPAPQDSIKVVYDLWLKALNLEESILHLTLEEALELQNYLRICLLMEQCQRVAVRVSRKTWNQLEAQMLCPSLSAP
jgi:hypothetical protein